MTKIHPPQTPTTGPTHAQSTQASGTQAAQHPAPAADTMAAAPETFETPTLQLHLPIPAQLRPMVTHLPQRPATFQSPSPPQEHDETAHGAQALAVAQGTLGLVEVAGPSHLPLHGIWSSPLSADHD